jgi:hypothetical protein
MYSYYAYGLSIDSEISLPELVIAQTNRADVTIRLGKLDFTPVCAERGEGMFPVNEEETGFFWEKVGTILVRRGREIIVDPIAGTDERLIRLPLTGVALGMLVHQRGFLVLHASAVAINGEVAAFLGGKGWGKSTLAAKLYRRGHTLMSDDVVALSITDDNPPMVVSGYPQFRLWPDSAIASLGDDPDKLPQLYDGYQKRARGVGCDFRHNILPLKALYKLEKGKEPNAVPLSPWEALFQLIGNSYVARYGKQILQGGRAALNLKQCANVINHVPFYRLERPQSLDLLETLADIVEGNSPRNLAISPDAQPAAVEALAHQV